MRSFFVSFLAGLAAILAAPMSTALAASAETYTGRLSNLALDGYDPVAYFIDGAPAKGSKDHQFAYKGATWRFASAENLARFTADPQAFAPQYGGYCAWAISQGYLARGAPEQWTIRNGRLFLNFDRKVQATWLMDPDGYIALADRNWPGVLSK